MAYFACLFWLSPVLAWGSEASCPRIPHKIPEDTVHLEPRTPRLEVKHPLSPQTFKVFRFTQHFHNALKF